MARSEGKSEGPSITVIDVDAQIEDVSTHEQPPQRVPEPRANRRIHPETKRLEPMRRYGVGNLDIAGLHLEAARLARAPLRSDVRRRGAEILPDARRDVVNYARVRGIQFPYGSA